MMEIHPHDKSFTGSFIATNLPPELCEISAHGNNFYPIEVVGSNKKAFIKLQRSGVTSVVGESGNEKFDRVRL